LGAVVKLLEIKFLLYHNLGEFASCSPMKLL